MMLLVLAIILTIISLGLLIYAFLSKPETSATKAKKQKDAKPKLDTKEPITLKSEDPMQSLKSELEKAKLDYQNIQNELNLAKQKESQLEQELARQNEWQAKDQAELEKIKKEGIRLKENLINKEKELEKEFALNLNLNKELKEGKEKLASLEQEKKEMADKIRMFEAQLSGCQKEIERQNKIILETKKKEAESEWISKKEYDALKRQLEESQETLKKLQSNQG